MNDQPAAGGLGCAYVGQCHIEQFKRDLEDIARAGIVRLYLPMTEEDAELRRPNLEAMASLARDAAIEPWLVPWGVGGLFGGPRGTRFVAQHLDARQIDSAGESLPAACPSNPLFQRFMENWIQQACDAGAEAILWDEPWWARHSALPGYRDMNTARLWACCCEHCRRRFRSLYRSETMPEEIDADVRDFRTRVLGSFLRELGETAEKRRLKSGLRLSPFGLPSTWELVTPHAWLTEIGVSTYWPPAASSAAGAEARFADFERQSEAAWGLLGRLQGASAARPRCWLRCFQIGREDEARIAPAVERLRALGATEFNIWSFAGTESLGALACERPREAWAEILQAVAKS